MLLVAMAACAPHEARISFTVGGEPWCGAHSVALTSGICRMSQSTNNVHTFAHDGPYTQYEYDQVIHALHKAHEDQPDPEYFTGTEDGTRGTTT
jgi:hypothetical protein